MPVEYLDTLIVSSNEEGFQKVFLGECCWYAVTIRDKIMPMVKYLAIYRKKPTSAVTHVAEIERIEQYKGIYHKYIVYFKKGTIQELPEKIGILAPNDSIQSTKYTTYNKLFTAKHIKEL